MVEEANNWKKLELPLDHPERQAIEGLEKWMDQNEGVYKKAKIKFRDENYRGVFASQDIEEGEQIIAVPSRMMIWQLMAEASPYGKLIKEKGLHLKFNFVMHSMMGVYLLQIRKLKENQFQPLLDALPRNFDHLPVLFGQDDLDFLEGTIFLEYVLNRRQGLQ